MSDDELELFLLAILPSDGDLTLDAIVQGWIHAAAAIKVNRKLEQLEAHGLVRSPKRGHWELVPK